MRSTRPGRYFFFLGIVLFAFTSCTRIQKSQPVDSATTPASTQVTRSTSQPTQSPLASPTPAKNQKGPRIHAVRTNQDLFSQGDIPRYEKFEITFQVNTTAENLQLPYDSAPPQGVKAGTGISVDAFFSPDNWRTVYQQPAFYYQEFQDEIKSGQEWYYPTSNFSWKVRFAPHQPGEWQFKLRAQDSRGISESQSQAFTVVESERKGFIRVSREDPRYFEFEDSTYFPALGYNMNYDHIRWINPVLDNEANFQAMSRNGIQLIRIWLSQWAIYGSAWNPWSSIDPELHNQYIGLTGLTFEQAYPGSEVSMRVDAGRNPCMFIGLWKARPAVKRSTDYRIRIRYKTMDISGPRKANHPYGLVAKTGGWLWQSGEYCHDPGTGKVISNYQSRNTDGWQILEGKLNTGENDFLPNFYLVMENVDQGKAWIDYVWIEEDLGNGQVGPNIVTKPWMAHHLYMEQRNSYAFDKVLELAEKYGVYLRPVVLEKNEWLFNQMNFQGQAILSDARCRDQELRNDPAECPTNRWFYGDGRRMTKIRWLQQAWWRYLQARWGYSTHIHSWELLNEGNPEDSDHYRLADEFGKYMHQFKPNDHLVSTSFWHSFPRESFWTNPDYSNVDFADIHQYVQSNDPGFVDTALATYELSMKLGASQSGSLRKPVIRGEIGFVERGTGIPTTQFEQDQEGIWLHNFIWGGINPGGLIESYWYENVHIVQKGKDGDLRYDHRDHYRAYFNFIRDIPLNNGNYRDAGAAVSNQNLRAWGQKDQVSGHAHLWMQNIDHTWKGVIDGKKIMPVSGKVKISGFEPGNQYLLQWWDPYQPDPSEQVIKEEILTAQADGSLSISIKELVSDLAVKIQPDQSASP